MSNREVWIKGKLMDLPAESLLADRIVKFEADHGGIWYWFMTDDVWTYEDILSEYTLIDRYDVKKIVNKLKNKEGMVDAFDLLSELEV